MAEAKAKKEEAKKEKNKSSLKKSTKLTQKDNKKETAKKEVTKDVAKKAPIVKKEASKPFGSRMKKFFKGAVSELKKVHWPNKQQLIAFTTVVVVAVIFMAVLIWVVDSGLTQLIKLVLKK